MPTTAQHPVKNYGRPITRPIIVKLLTMNDKNLIFKSLKNLKSAVMQIFRFSANLADFVAKNVIFVNRLNPLRQFRGMVGVGGAQCIFRLFV